MSWSDRRPIQRMTDRDDNEAAGGSAKSVWFFGSHDGTVLAGYKFPHPVTLTRISAGMLVGVLDADEDTRVKVFNDGIAGTDQVFETLTFDMGAVASLADSETAIENAGKQHMTAAHELIVQAELDAGSFELGPIWVLLEYIDRRN